jgi:hypothetical protein
MLRGNRDRWLLGVAGAIVLVLGVSYGQRQLRHSSADHGFKSFTGVSLPEHVKATAHGSTVGDNLFHETHYWMLNGPENSLRDLASSFGLERSDEDAKWKLPEMQTLFGVSTNQADIVEGYEGSLDGKRDHWLIIFRNGKGAVLAY